MLVEQFFLCLSKQILRKFLIYSVRICLLDVLLVYVSDRTGLLDIVLIRYQLHDVCTLICSVLSSEPTSHTVDYSSKFLISNLFVHI